MKTKLFFLLLVILSLNANSQIDFLPIVVTENITGTHNLNSTYASDLDGDGDLDLLSAARWNDKISWYENLNGLGLYSDEQIVSHFTADGPSSVQAVDIDNDGDNDVISSSGFDNKIAWYENIDGEGTFGSSQVITTNAMGAIRVSSADIDGDGDTDILSASINDAKIAWYENTDGEGTFGPAQIILIDEYQAVFVLPADIDNDGDIDVLSSTRGNNDNSGKIAWHENTDGEGTFDIEHIIYFGGWAPNSISAKDLNGDGYLDVLLAYRGNDLLLWHENLNGLGDFGDRRIITGNIEDASFVNAGDIDNDGDLDVFSTSISDSKLAWYENIDGLGNFGIQQIISDNLYSPEEVHLNDINNDGDLDVITVSGEDNRIVWYTNNGLISNKINGIVRLDLDNNGCDSSDLAIPGLMITTSDSSNTYSTFTLSNGTFQFFPFEGDFTTSIVSTLPNYYTSNPSSHNNNFTDVGNEVNADFCLEPSIDINDLSISIYPLNDPRPGFDIIYKLVYRNLGTTQISGEIVYEYNNSIIQFLSASETVIDQTTNSITFEFEDLSPFETRTIDIEFNVFPPPSVEIGDIISTSLTINPILSDNSPDDNLFNLEQIVIGSFDPNDIIVLEGDEILFENVDKYLHYIIRFQNTGTAEAINVKVENILDQKLDWTTMQLEILSHDSRVEITNGSQVNFIFEDINLPDSTNDEPNSHGYIAYKIKPKSNVEIGDVFNNSADIFFDFNPAIITNTVNTEIVNALSTNEHDFYSFQVYPNPTTGILHINTIKQIDLVQLFNGLGQLVFSQKNKNVVNISNLKKGIYFIKVNDMYGNFEIKKILKE